RLSNVNCMVEKCRLCIHPRVHTCTPTRVARLHMEAYILLKRAYNTPSILYLSCLFPELQMSKQTAWTHQWLTAAGPGDENELKRYDVLRCSVSPGDTVVTVAAPLLLTKDKSVAIIFITAVTRNSVQGEQCPRSPLQRASLSTHCANPDDIVTMHHSPEQDQAY
ncbi:hypothetical protein JOQ06_030291, partial [Pogonophryne albipinna]